ncbi:winged helix-turn-helix domain-containing protein [Solirubrobacter ginsenosidimutans]|uniref:Winged helix-turn-helix domain-containing protein n=1 Tax=Solirubrobacter ginsenosidimutans TaxID=490573 RepID=A0A9X3MSX8_9ACTN|nr:winged helix-turn-helix domain-containing protein [Solirubrobacter ginsenosidimutans]MDA0161965.1 winged helix-turn-helix domain-containing protein [Solirubrobacter ginsenosidimutans]
MDYRVLGPLEVLDGGGKPLMLGGRKPRALLARLLLDANRTVSVERLVDDLWGEDVPDSAVKMVHIHVSALRKALPAGTLQTRQPGYALEVDPELINVVRFERLQAEGRAALDRGFTRAVVARFRGDTLPAPEGRVRASFDGPARAVRCAAALAEVQPELRAGVHTGECERHNGTLTGPALDIAVRVAEAARPGEILATSTVHDLVALSGVAFEERGAVALPGPRGSGGCSP